MSEQKEKEPITKEEKEEEKKVEKKAKNTTTKKTNTKKKTASKNQTTKKAATKKQTTKKAATKKTTTKKMVKKATKPTKRSTKKDDKKSKKTSKKATTTKAKGATKKTSAAAAKDIKKGLYTKWVSEAIFNLKTDEKQYVSYARIKQYLLDYMDTGLVQFIPKRTKKTLESLKEKKLLKAKKDSYTFTSQGLKTIAPEKTIKRKKVSRPEKKTNKVVETKEPVKKEFVTQSGRVSKQTSYE